MTNEAHIVKWQTDGETASLRLWVDDERGQHLCVAELHIPALRMLVMAMEVERVRQEAAQQTLW